MRIARHFSAGIEDERFTPLSPVGTTECTSARNELGLSRDGFNPRQTSSRTVYEQKLSYLHENPTRKGLVQHPADWWYSSAAFYEGRTAVCMNVEVLEM